MEVIFCQVLVFIILSQCDADYSWQNRLFGQIYCRCDLSGKNAAKIVGADLSVNNTEGPLSI